MSKSSEDTAPEPNIGALLSAAFRAFVTELHDRLAEAGYPDVRPAQTSVFQFIGQNGARVTEMAERAQMTKQGMAELVAYLEERGYVERAPDPTDGRAKIVRLTPIGWRVVEMGTKAIDDIEASWARRIGPERMRELRSMLVDLVEGTNE